MLENLKIQKQKRNLASPSSSSVLAWFWLCCWSFFNSSLTLETFCFLIGSSRIGEFDLFRLSRRHFVSWSSTLPAFLLKQIKWFGLFVYYFNFQISRHSKAEILSRIHATFLTRLRHPQISKISQFCFTAKM